MQIELGFCFQSGFHWLIVLPASEAWSSSATIRSIACACRPTQTISLTIAIISRLVHRLHQALCAGHQVVQVWTARAQTTAAATGRRE